MEAISTGVNLTAAAGGGDGAPLPLPLDAGSIFVLAATLLVFCAPLLWLFPPFPPRRSDALAETHTRLGLAADSFSSSSSSPAAEFDLRAAAALEAPGAAGGIVRSLFVYPVKSCKGIELARAKVVPTGLEFDRLFTLAQLRSPFPVAAGDNLGPRGGGTAGEQQQHRWEFITQRQFPLLATVEVELWRPDLAKIKGFRDPSAGSSDEVFLVLRFPWRRRVAGGGPLGLLGAAWELLGAKCARGWRAEPQVEVLLPVEYPSRADAARKGYAVEGVRVWGEEVAALNMGSELPPELGLYLGVSNKLALFRVDPEAPREVFKCAPGRDEAGYQPVVGFQDSYPVHVMNLASVQDVEAKVAKDEELKDLSPRRFRANVFVSGLPPYDEDDWKKIKFSSPPSAAAGEGPRRQQQQQPQKQSGGEANTSTTTTTTFHVSCRTTRCKLPNVDPDTGARHAAEPDRTLRRDRAIDDGAPGKGCLGMQMTPLFEGAGGRETYLEVGMSIEVLERGPHRYKK